MFQTTLNGVSLALTTGDIANQRDCDAIVNAANARLETGGGVAGAIHKAAGPGLAEECRPWAPIKPGQAVLSSGHNLPNDHVIHCLGPVYGQDQPSDDLLMDCYKNALILADQKGIRCLAFPAISTGAFGYPFKEAMAIALKAVKDRAPRLNSVSSIRFVLFSEKDLEAAEEIANEELS
jgi:O-acetyl-ADP-ribose deacetylase (regulator of RNase III)